MNNKHSTTRREFIVQASAGTAAAVVAGTFVRRAVAAPGAASAYLTSKDTSTDPQFVSATRIAQMIREKQLSAVDAVKACYARIDQVNPTINAVVAFCRERALAEAKLADESLAAGKILGPLHGVPFTIKDSFDTEGVLSTGGTLGRKGYIPGKDATVVARLRKAGGILLGTYYFIFVQTHNADNSGYSPCGCSGDVGAILAIAGSYCDICSDYGGS